MEISKGRGLTSHLQVEMQLSHNSLDAEAHGKGELGREVLLPATPEGERLPATQNKSGPGSIPDLHALPDSKLKHQDHSIFLVSIY